MRRVLLGLGTALMMMTVTAAEAQAQTVQLMAVLSGANETPGVTTGANGTATVTVNLATQAVTYRIDVFNMPTGTTAGHFHVGGPGLSGPTVVNFTIPTGISNDYGFEGTATASSLNARDAQGIRSWEDFIQALLGGQIYINIHSQANPGGEVRGQVVRVP